MDNNGLTYLCMTAERFFAVSTVLNNMVENQLVKPSTRLLKHIIKCYFRLSENPRAQMALNTTMPSIVREMLNDNKKLTEHLDESSKKLLSSLIETLQLSSQRNTGLLGSAEGEAGAQTDKGASGGDLVDFNLGSAASGQSSSQQHMMEHGGSSYDGVQQFQRQHSH